MPKAKLPPLVAPNVHVRIRPLGDCGGHVADGPSVYKELSRFDEKAVYISDRHNITRYDFCKSVFGPESCQESVYNEVAADNVKEFASGVYNALIFSYGQTGTGKTWTILGPEQSWDSAGDHELSGILPRAVKQTFDTLEGKGDPFVLSASAMEFYMLDCFDLLDPEHPSVLIHPDTGYPVGLDTVHLKSVNDIIPFIKKVQEKRATASTRMNPAFAGHSGSSRSHAAIMLTLIRRDLAADRIHTSVLNIVDLAGAERPSSNGYEGGGAWEAITDYYKGNYSRCLQAQGVVVNFELCQLRSAMVNAINQHKARRPFTVPRQLATAFIKYASGCFCGRNKLSMCVTMSQAPSFGWETWFSCEYGKDIGKLRCPVAHLKANSTKKAVSDAHKASEGPLISKTPKGDASSKFHHRRYLEQKAALQLKQFLSLIMG